MNQGSIVVFGDSIAWGSWDLDGGGWVQRLKRQYMERQAADPSPYGYVTVNECAVPGHRVADIRTRLVADLESIDPEVAVLAVGINDAPNYEHRRGTSKAQFETDYAFLLDSCLERNIKTVAVSATSADERWLGWQNADIEEINKSIAVLCAARGVAVIDVFHLLERKHVDKDGIHPNSTGHQLMYSTLLAHLDAMGISR